MRKDAIITVVTAVLWTAACNGQPQQQTLPTLAVTPTPQVTTAVPATGSPAPTRVPPTPPPTWTPEVPATETPPPTAIPPTAGPRFTPSTALAACAAFTEDVGRSTRSFSLGATPQVFWTQVAGAATYRVSLVRADPASENPEELVEVFSDFTAETNYTFQADLFELGKLYGWEVFPVDGIGQQMCTAIGNELTPT